MFGYPGLNLSPKEEELSPEDTIWLNYVFLLESSLLFTFLCAGSLFIGLLIQRGRSNPAEKLSALAFMLIAIKCILRAGLTLWFHWVGYLGFYLMVVFSATPSQLVMLQCGSAALLCTQYLEIDFHSNYWGFGMLAVMPLLQILDTRDIQGVLFGPLAWAEGVCKNTVDYILKKPGRAGLNHVDFGALLADWCYRFGLLYIALQLLPAYGPNPDVILTLSQLIFPESQGILETKADANWVRGMAQEHLSFVRSPLHQLCLTCFAVSACSSFVTVPIKLRVFPRTRGTTTDSAIDDALERALPYLLVLFMEVLLFRIFGLDGLATLGLSSSTDTPQVDEDMDSYFLMAAYDLVLWPVILVATTHFSFQRGAEEALSECVNEEVALGNMGIKMIVRVSLAYAVLMTMSAIPMAALIGSFGFSTLLVMNALTCHLPLPPPLHALPSSPLTLPFLSSTPQILLFRHPIIILVNVSGQALKAMVYMLDSLTMRYYGIGRPQQFGPTGIFGVDTLMHVVEGVLIFIKLLLGLAVIIITLGFSGLGWGDVTLSPLHVHLSLRALQVWWQEAHQRWQAFRLFIQHVRSKPSWKRITEESLAKLNEEGEVCVMCMEELTFSSGISTPCKPVPHYFHAECLNRWMYRSSKCPMCQAEILMPEAPEAPGPSVGEAEAVAEAVAEAEAEAGEKTASGAGPESKSDVGEELKPGYGIGPEREEGVLGEMALDSAGDQESRELRG
ncbi:unnamed protein product [Chrysoparadoxa australica]